MIQLFRTKLLAGVSILAIGLSLLLPLVHAPTALAATTNITSLVFTTAAQSITQDTASDTISVQTQNSSQLAEDLDTSSNPLTVSSSSTTGRFATSSSNTWSSTNTTSFTMSKNTANKNFVYEDSTPGTYMLTASLSASGNIWTAQQTVTVISSDTTAPVIVPSITPAPNAAGWNNSDVSVSWSVSDPESTISSQTGCDTTTLSTETGGTTLTCSATSAGGGSSDPVTVKIDKTAPVITASSSAVANLNGWNNSTVTATFACTNSGSVQSGAGGSSSIVLSSDGIDQSTASPNNFCVDAAGNIAVPVTIDNISIDTTSPTASITPPADAQTVSGIVNFTGTASDDNFAGYNLTINDADGNPTICTATGATAVQDGALGSCDTTQLADGNYTAVFTVTDLAGNSSTTQTSFTVDNTPPITTLPTSDNPANSDISNSNIIVTQTPIIAAAASDPSPAASTFSPTIADNFSAPAPDNAPQTTPTSAMNNQQNARLDDKELPPNANFLQRNWPWELASVAIVAALAWLLARRNSSA